MAWDAGNQSSIPKPPSRDRTQFRCRMQMATAVTGRAGSCSRRGAVILAGAARRVLRAERHQHAPLLRARRGLTAEPRPPPYACSGSAARPSFPARPRRDQDHGTRGLGAQPVGGARRRPPLRAVRTVAGRGWPCRSDPALLVLHMADLLRTLRLASRVRQQSPLGGFARPLPPTSGARRSRASGFWMAPSIAPIRSHPPYLCRCCAC